MIENKQYAKRKAVTKNKVTIQDTPQHYDMVVFCHLRWGFVYQRPQHIISRMAKTMKVLFIEEPLEYHENQSSGGLLVVHERLHILQPHVTDISAIAGILPHFISNKKVPVGWFYSAAFSPLLASFDFEQVVYDCMDELSLFKNASAHLIHQERLLLRHADIVFTGGKSLYESKKQSHFNVYCFPSSVDADHFAQALNGIAVPDDIASIPSPIVGYFGVIDERINLDLLRGVAAKLPSVSFVMLGPLAKIAATDLPKAANIHYLGMKTYQELPHYLKAFSIAMMPFALNEATQYISPTKTLEYMAAMKPIISTKIADVVRDYSSCVSLIDTAEEFCDAAVTLLAQNDHLANEMAYYSVLQNTSWNVTVAEMKVRMKTFAS